MTDRLDRIEAILERHTDEIDTLLGAVSTTETAINNLVVEMAKTNAAVAESNQRFDVLRAEAIADRQEANQKFNDAIAQMGTDREEHRTSFNNAIAQMDTDREEHRTSFNNAIAQMDTDRENAIAQMDTDRQRSDERYQTQLEVIQSLLMALGRTNRDVGEVETAIGQLGNRVDNLEAS